MKQSTLSVLKAVSLSVALMGSVALVSALALPDAAYAKSGNDNGGGGGKSGGNGKSDSKGKSEKSGGKAEKSGGKAADAGKTKTKAKTKPKAKPKKKDLAGELGVHPSELGALNAAHANPNAFKNASPNSRVGRIAAYRDAVLGGQELATSLAEKEALLATLTPPSRPSTDVATDLATATSDVQAKSDEIAQLEADLEAAGGVDPVIEAELETARQELADLQTVEGGLKAEYDAAAAYETLETEIADLTQQIADQPALERSLLEAAANKPVTDAVEAAVKKLLGL